MGGDRAGEKNLEGGGNRWAVGIGMVPRGEVGLIFAGIGVRLTLEGEPLLTQGIFAAIVLMVLVTTLVAPIGLRWVFARPGKVGPEAKNFGHVKRGDQP